ncbi:MAG: DUF4245 domain-containing protein [Nocardiaceae bacterium]|nr:DUF4245 domain-containing protein [Nocardiaceae bacterium]
MAGQNARIFAGAKDMLWAVIGLALMCLVIAGLAGQCSFSPGGPTIGPVHRFDAEAGLKEDAANLAFPVRIPAVPNGWIPNSGNKNAVPGQGGGPATTVGYVTAGKRFIQVTQTSATEEALVRLQAPTSPSSGIQTVDGVSWIVYPGDNGEPVWIANFGDVRISLRGTADPAEFGALAKAMKAAKPLPK